ncbi:TonB family protein [Parapedobacter koreensis]|uniref:TonB family C-terminal domain-containing protein n=1 Tax=Parapedobacter koreensis TaxID=332977 RepID=A0A1H7STB6_9SPHI|nr:TonB family protein [Parapedobacter koreensis]SEL75579.1 TonB family C-terminal domain-containing protein [Parapedobacter koreensis]
MMMYLLLANFYLVIFYGFYYLSLRKETFFRWNRIYLLGGMVLAYTLPFMEYSAWHAYTGYRPYLPVIQANDTVVVQYTAAEEVNLTTATRQYILVYGYVAGCAVAFLLFAFRLLGTLRLLNGRSRGKAFSFFGAIRIDRALGGHELINRHEQVHVSEWHSIDILLIELVKIFNWFNPVVYRYERAIKLQHEYIADGKTAAGDDIGYAELLVSHAMGVERRLLANTFSDKRLLTSRISMLLRDKSPQQRLFRYVWLLPIVVGLAVFSIACNQSGGDNGKETEMTAATGLDTNDFRKALGQQVSYSKDALANNMQGMLAVAYEKVGNSFESIQFLNRLGHGQEAEVLRVMQQEEVERLAPEGKNMFTITFKIQGLASTDLSSPPPPMSPDHTQLGDLVIIGYAAEPPPPPPVDPRSAKTDKKAPEIVVIPKPKIQQHLTIKVEDTPQDAAAEEGSDALFQSVEVNPEPPGGLRAFMEYIGKNYDYPQEAIDQGVNGQVQVSFIINKDGSLTDLKLVRDLGYGTGDAAIRVLQKSANWSPGIQNGRPVRVAYTLPIRLNLQQ